MALRLLGPVEVVVDQHVRELGGPKERALLALLALERGPISSQRLVTELWDDEAPPSARKTLQTYVWRLRRVLPEGVLLSRPGGYELLDDRTDAATFERSVLEASELLAADDAFRARRLFADALQLWRGEPFSGCAPSATLLARAVWLDELRMRAVEGRLEADLRLGRHAALVGELEHEVRHAPFRERLWEMLVLALFRCGRQAEALRACQRARAVLIDEIGVEPGPALRDLEHAVLEQRPSLDQAAAIQSVGPETPEQATAAAMSPEVGGAGSVMTAFSGGRRHNLPLATTTFIGRRSALPRLVADISTHRLMSLTGPGGVGKTRLALEAARSAVEHFVDGVWLCELAPINDPDAVVHAVADAISVRPQEGLSVMQSVVDAVRERRLLIVLDCCEHVLDGAAELASSLVESCPHIALLATSREPLGLLGERVWVVPPLVPEVEGVELFLDRAVVADASFAVSGRDRDIIADIAVRLDGIPLAIELAAARVRSMTPFDLAERLVDRFELLRGASRGVDLRHQTMQAAVQWSYDLLTDDERLLFDRLGVFAGSFDVEAARGVCADEQLPAQRLPGLVDALVDKSLVVAVRTPTQMRFRLLETLRDYACERLQAASTLANMRDRHLSQYVLIAQRAQAAYEGRAHAEGAAAFHAEWDNIRAGVHHAITTGNRDSAAHIIASLFFFSWCDVRHELGEWASQVVEAGGATAAVHGVAAFFAVQRGDRDEGVRLAEAGINEGGGYGEFVCRYALAFAYWYSGRVSEGWEMDRTLNQLADRACRPFAVASAATIAASHACYVDPSAAPMYLQRARGMASHLQNPSVDAMVEWASGMVARTDGRLDAALGHLGRALVIAEGAGNRLLAGLARLSAAITASMSGAPSADQALRDALNHLYSIRDWHLWLIVEAIALHFIAADRLEPAAVLLGHLETRDVRHGAFAGRREEALRQLADVPDADAWLAKGATLDREQIMAFALDELSGPG